MIIRVVKMVFQEDKIEAFKTLFEQHKEKIRASAGCMHLELLQQTDNPNCFFTYSWWEEEYYLEGYKDSVVFKDVWPATKALFAEKPEAWSMEQLRLLD